MVVGRKMEKSQVSFALYMDFPPIMFKSDLGP